MSDKIILNRKTKEVKLPECGATLQIYASIVVRDLEGIKISKIDDTDNINDAIKLITRIIKSWNVYEKEEDLVPKEITEKSVGEFPINDLKVIFKEFEVFSAEEKKE